MRVMKIIIFRLVPVSLLSAALATAIEHFQAPGVVGYWVGFVSGASVLALLEVMDVRTK